MLEFMFKRLLYQDCTMSAARELLKDKVLRFELAEWGAPLILVFSEHQIDVFNVWDGFADCTVRTCLATLPALLEHHQLTQLIKQGLLDVQGDPQCVKQFITLINMAQFDAADLLSPWFGDIVAEGITQILARRLTEVRRFLQIGQGWVRQAITDEWHLAPSSLELAWFFSEVDDVTRANENLAAVLDKLRISR